jgi:hypothetical protein
VHSRRYRPDYMTQFPFADETGTVKDIFQQNIPPSIDILSMGLPGRKKLITKVFDIMRFDRNGIRLSDLPESLEVRSISTCYRYTINFNFHSHRW